MEIQEAYETMRRYFAAKGDEEAAAYEGSGCKYRTEDGRCCAVGCLIPPALYDPILEGVGSVFGLYGRGEKASSAVADFLGITDATVSRWSALQGAHDDAAIHANAEGRTATGNEVAARLDLEAERMGLETPQTIRNAALAQVEQDVAERFGRAA